MKFKNYIMPTDGGATSQLYQLILICSIAAEANQRLAGGLFSSVTFCSTGPSTTLYAIDCSKTNIK